MKVEMKLCTSRAGDRTRVWLQGSRLSEHGFTVGRKFLRAWDGRTLVLTACTVAQFDKAAHGSRGTVSGSETRPVIDLISATFPETFKGDTVAVTYARGRIEVR